MRTNYSFKLFFFNLIMVLLSFGNMYGNIVSVPDEIADFAILSNDNLNATNSIYATGKIGARNAIIGNFIASQGTSSGSTAVLVGLDSLNQFINLLNLLSSVPLSNNLNGIAINPGTYSISGNVLLDTIINIIGIDTDQVIFNINGNLTINSSTYIVTNGIHYNNVIWNVSGQITFNGHSSFKGIAISSGQITTSNSAASHINLLSMNSIIFSSIINWPDPYESYNYAESTFNLVCPFPSFNCNYVKNDKFEIADQIPQNANQLQRACGWFPTARTPDYFSAFSPSIVKIPTNLIGNQPARSGSYYAGLIVDGPAFTREYITNELYNPLTPGKYYYGEFYAVLSESSSWAIQNLGMYFTPNIPVQFINQNPQIENNSIVSDCNVWTKVSNCFQATGGESYLTIGNFRTSGATTTNGASPCFDPNTYPIGNGLSFSYYFIEDVGVYELPSISNHTLSVDCGSQIQIQPTICDKLSYPYNTISYSWSPATNLSSSSVADPYVNGNNSGPSTIHYTVTITLNNGCSMTDYVDVTFNHMTLNMTSTSETCSPQSANGTATATPIGGVSPYSYLWSNSQTGQTATGLHSGPISVVVTDVNGCTATSTVTVIGISPPDAIISGLDYVCDNHDNQWTYTVSPYNPSYSYVWTFKNLANTVLFTQTGGQTATINWVLANGGNFGGIVTLTINNNGCISTINYYVQNCCKGDNNYVQWNNLSISQLYPLGGSMSIPPPTVYVNGTLTIDVNFAINNINTSFYMGPGSRILVKSGITFRLNKSTLQSGCNQMWRGVELESNSYIICEQNSIIRDAEHAIKAHSGSNIELKTNTTFKNNFNCVYYPPTNTPSPAVNLLLSEVNFTGGTLIPSYLGQVDYGPSAFSGMIINNAALLNITNGLATTPNIFFDRLSNGIIAHNSSLYVRKTQFKNILRAAAYNSLGTWNGSGIYADGGGVVDQVGEGNLTTSTKSFDNCFTGIYTNAMKIISSLNNMNVLRSGYYITNTDASYSSTVTSNRIATTLYGITFTFNLPNADIQIDKNDITVTPTASGIGIASIEGRINTSAKILNNNIYLGSSAQVCTGIFLGTVNTNKVELNHIYILGNGPSNTGIFLSNSNDNNVNCNHIEKSTLSTQINIKAIKIVTSINNTINCNYMDKTGTGFYAEGLSLMPDKFSGNEFHNLMRGIDFNLAGDIGDQNNRGNLWFSNPYPSFGGFAVSGSGANSIFNVPTSCFPIGNFCTNGNGIFLMTYAAGIAPWECGSFYCSAPQFNVNSLNGLLPLDYRIANETFEIGGDEEVIQHETDKFLYDKIKDLDLNTMPQNFIDFYNEKKISSVGIFSEINSEMQTINVSKVDSIKSEIFVNDSLITIYTDSINSLNNLMANESDLTIIQYLKIQIEYYNTLIINSFELNKTYRQFTTLVGSEELLPIIAKNNIAPTVEVQEQNEKFVNDIYLKNIVNQQPISFTQHAILLNIANLCPLDGGSAVFMARSILMIEDNLFWDDEEICAPQGIAPRMASQQNEFDHKLEVYPNPSSGTATFDFELSDQVQLTLYDYCGRVLKEVYINEPSSTLTFDLSKIESSFIYYKYHSSKYEKQGKIIIIR